MSRLTLARIRTAKPNGNKPKLYSDEPTLYLRVEANGVKRWIQRITINGQRTDLGLGGWPLVTLREARDTAIDNRRAVRRGEDPRAERRAARIPTLIDAARAALATRTFKTARARDRWIGVVELHAKPLHARRLDAIDAPMLANVLRPIQGSATAKKVLQTLSATYTWAQAKHPDLRDPTPSAAVLLPKSAAASQHRPAMPYQDVPAALTAIQSASSPDTAKLALRFAVLTAARNGEVLGATWSEIDEDAATWTVPGERMKAGKAHTVPLSDAALETLRAARLYRDRSGLVFPSTLAGRKQSSASLIRLLRAAGIETATAHGFRSSFRDWAGERTNTDFAVMETSLAHAVGSAVERAYSRSDLLAKRRRLMDSWAAFATDQPAQVVKLHA